MNAEQTYCRGPLARWFNQDPGHPWIPNRNFSGLNRLGYESGRPDGFVCWAGRFLAVECKAGLGSVYLGDPEDPRSTEGWHYHQRNWWQHVARPSGMSYWICVWIYPERSPTRVVNRQASCYLVTPEAWMATEARLGPERRTLAASPDTERVHRFKHVTAATEWRGNELHYEHGTWAIPPQHPFWKSISELGEEK